MKKQMLLLVVAVLLLAVVTGALLLVTHYDSVGDVSRPQDTQGISLLGVLGGDIDSVCISLAHESFALARSNSQYIIEEYQDMPISYSMASGAFEALSNCYATVIENPGALSEYGLDRPSVITARMADGSSFELLLGNQPPMGSGVYAALPDSQKVYLLSDPRMNYFKQGSLFFSDLTITPKAANSQNPVPVSVRLGGSVRDATINIEQAEADGNYSTGVYHMSAPKSYSVSDDDKVLRVFQGMLGLTADETVAYVTDKAVLEEYHLKEPYSTIEITTEMGQTYLISASQPKNGKVFLFKEGIPVIYQVNQSKLPWLEWQYWEIVSPLVVVPYLNRLESVTISAGSMQQVFNVDLVEGDLFVTTPGLELELDRFKEFYQCLISLPAEHHVKEPPQSVAPELLTIEYRYKDGSEKDTIKILEGNGVQGYLEINGEAEFLTQSHYAQIIVNNMNNLFNKKTIEPLY